MRHLFSTKVRIILVLAVLLAAGLAVIAGVSEQSLPEVIVQGVMAPFRAAGTALTDTAEKYYSYMFRYEALEAENAALKADIAEMEDVARQADSVNRENQRLRAMLGFSESHESYNMVDAYIIGWHSTDWNNTYTINRGSNSGIDVNMCATTANGETFLSWEG